MHSIGKSCKVAELLSCLYCAGELAGYEQQCEIWFLQASV